MDRICMGQKCLHQRKGEFLYWIEDIWDDEGRNSKEKDRHVKNHERKSNVDMRLGEEIEGWERRFLSKVTPSSLPVKQMYLQRRWKLRLESNWSLGLVPKQIASVLVGFRTRPLWMKQLWREETHHWRLQRLLDKDEEEKKTKSCKSSAFYCWLTPWEDTIEAIGET